MKKHAVFSPRYKFSDWPNPAVPAVAAGVYSIWKGDLLVYCGMSCPNMLSKAPKKKSGLIVRLAHHRSGRLSGDQFCVYIANRFIVPMLTSRRLPHFASGKLKLDHLAKDFIRAQLEYQFALVGTKTDAVELEQNCRLGLVFGSKPLLNPLKP